VRLAPDGLAHRRDQRRLAVLGRLEERADRGKATGECPDRLTVAGCGS
jgi:hypothetical protein